MTILISEIDLDTTGQLCIRGRSFDLSKGLPIGANGYVLRIKEVEQASLGTGLNTWDGSVILAKYLETLPHLVADRTVLELGAGTGVAGIAAGLLGARSVLLTDLEYTLENLGSNVRDNAQQMEREFEQCSDRNNSNANNELCSSLSSSARYSSPFRVAKLDWADPASYPPEAVDLVLGADIVWLEHLVPDLVRALTAVVGERTTLLMSHQVIVSLTENTS